MFLDSWVHSIFRRGSTGTRDVQLDCMVLAGLSLLLIATGIGWRDPWPADEPRFALVVRDMVASGNWLLPRVAGDLYADKPPLFFWLMAAALKMTGSLRATFLLPSLCSALGTVLLIYDLARRLWGRGTGLIAGISLLTTIQFVWEARQAQIDATLCFWTTLGLYGLLRHLLVGPNWTWYVLAWAAAGLGVITKGVGFLPLLVLLPFMVLRAPAWQPRLRQGWSWRWLLGPVAFIIATGLWLVPMLLAANHDPTLAAYRDEILFRQTVDRYAQAWHHREPLWFFFTNVIPWLWLPLTALLPWFVPQWRTALKQHDLRIALPACWIVMVVLFFSFSSGKRGVYVLPAVPALALLCAPYLHAIARNSRAQHVLFGLATLLCSVCLLGNVYLLLRTEEWLKVILEQQIDPQGPLLLLGAGIILMCAWLQPGRGFLVFVASQVLTLLVISFWINPVINAVRSGALFMAGVERRAAGHGELGLFAFKEQYMLNATQPVVHFGHARWREREQELDDAARWVSATMGRQLLVNEWGRQRCFSQAVAEPLGIANREKWYLVRGGAQPECIARGTDVSIYHYVPPPNRNATAVNHKLNWSAGKRSPR